MVDTATQALQMAREALTRQHGHEELCSDRWTELRLEMKAIKKQQWWFVITLIGAQGGLIWFLINRLPGMT